MKQDDAHDTCSLAQGDGNIHKQTPLITGTPPFEIAKSKIEALRHVDTWRSRPSALGTCEAYTQQRSLQQRGIMDVDDDGGNVDRSRSVSGVSEAERFALLRAAVKVAPNDYTAHLSLVGYLRGQRPGSLDLLKARQE